MSKQRRLSKVFSQDGKSVTLALDGYFFSPKTADIDDTIKIIPALIDNGLDCALITYGMTNNYAKEFTNIPIILRVDSSINIYNNSVPDTQQVFCIENALKVDVDGIICMTFPGVFNEEKIHTMAVTNSYQSAST